MTNAEPDPDDVAQADEQDSRFADVDALAYGKIAAAAVVGLAVNALAVGVVSTGGMAGLLDGVVYLSFGAVLGAFVFHAYNPLDVPYLGGVVLFVTLWLANTLSLSVRVYGTPLASDAVATVLILAVVALLFTPGPAVAVWATRRYALEPVDGAGVGGA